MNIPILSIGRIAALLTASAFSSPALSETLPDSYSVGNDTPMTLGRAFYPANLYAVPPSDCFKSKIKKGEGGWSEVKLSSVLVNDYTSLLDSQNVSVEVHVQSPTNSVDGKYAASRALVSNSRNVSIVVQAYAEIPNIVAENPTLRLRFRQLLETDPDRFVAECGSRFAKIEHRGISLSAVITIVDASQSLKSKMQTSAAASYGASSFSASAKAAFDQEIATAQSNNRYEVKVFAQGGPGVAGLSDLVRSTVVSSPSIDQIGAALADYLKNVTPENAVVMRFDVSDLPMAGTQLKTPWTREKGLLLKHLVDSYLSLNDRRSIVARIAADNDPRFHTLESDDRAVFGTLIERFDTTIDRILQIHSSCMATKPPTLAVCRELNTEISTALQIDIPSPIQPPRGRFGIAVMEGNRWRMLPASDQDNAFLSPLAGNAVPGYDGPVPTDYFSRLAQRVSGVVPEATHFALAYLVSADNLASIELRAVSNTKHQSEAQKQSLAAWGQADLANREFAPYPLVDKTEPLSPYNHWLILSVGQLKPDDSPVGPELSPHLNYAAQMARAARDFSLKEPKTEGSGRLELVIRDSFSGDPIISKLNDFSWDRDDALGIVKVDYSSNTGEPKDTFFVTGLSPVSIGFPDLMRQENWSGKVENATSKDWGAIADKWGYLTIINCDAKVRVTSLSPEIHILNTRVQTVSKSPENVRTMIDRPLSHMGIHSLEFNSKVNISYRALLRGESKDASFNQRCRSAPQP